MVALTQILFFHVYPQGDFAPATGLKAVFDTPQVTRNQGE